MKRFKVQLAPSYDKCCIIDGNIKVAVLSENIIRVEKVASKNFVDNCSQTVINRAFCTPEFKSETDKKTISIFTSKHKFVINKHNLRIFVDNVLAKTGGDQNLKGTTRTLDGKAGAVNLEDGLFSKEGVVLFDDSKTLLLLEDGSITTREKHSKDMYIFAFGSNFYQGLKEFYALTGYPPVLPKYVFGNWWSRYHAYSDKEYIDLMKQFKEKEIPFTVATIDMDWHIVDIPKDVHEKTFFINRGWTGYTFNKNLFPDYKAFFKTLKDMNLHITMNLHPRDGVRYFEEQYEQMAKANHIDPKTKRKVEFDLTNKDFLTSYFDILHHPYEEAGVDFWWIDWQQGTKSKMKGLDPLWLLNHYHTMDNCRNNNKGLILSRYAGIGSHRYPLGFSGDTYVTWEALDFQPYFTINASNVGYTWWSHDIGGHMCNKGDNELYLRWLQFGTFAPINRLHSTSTTLSKEPWNYPKVCDYAIKYLQLRHKLIPYLYSANIDTATIGLPLIQPLYYKYNEENAYKKEYRNEYLFGTEMLVCPVTAKGDKNGRVQQKVWLPQGVWTDFFTGKTYLGNKEYNIDCAIDYIPVFVKEGGIVPMLSNYKDNDIAYKNIELKVSVGENSYTLFDEVGNVKFIQEKTVNGYNFAIQPNDGINIQNLSIDFINIESADIAIDNTKISANKINLNTLSNTIKLTNIVWKK